MKNLLFTFFILLSSASFFSQKIYAQACPLTGTVTINSATITGGTNFQSFNALAAHLSTCGVSGTVTVNVVPGSGPYNEQVIFENIAGLSPFNPITLNGNGETITFLTTAANRHIIRLKDLNGFYLKNLNIVRDPLATSGFMGVHIFNIGKNIFLDSISVNMSGSTSTLVGGIIASADTASILSGGDFDTLMITNCTTTGGGYGVSIYGQSASNLADAIDIANNTITGTNSNGIYLRETNYASVYQNDITIAAGNGIQLAQALNQNGMVTRNKIAANSTVTTTVRGIYIFGNTPLSTNRVINNIIHEFNAPAATIYGIVSRAGGQYYNNTVVLDDQNATATGNTYAFYEELSNTYSDIVNNIFYVTRSSTGTKAGIALGSTTNIVTSVNTDYNVFYIPSGNVVTRGTTNYATLSSWNTASTQDANSFETNPGFVYSLFPQPTSPVIDNQGLSIPIVSIDYTGALRPAAPDPGALEFTGVAQNDVGVVSLLNPTNNICGSDTMLVEFIISNNGNSVLSNIPINAIVTGGATANLSGIYTGTLNPGNTDTVALGFVNSTGGGLVDITVFTSLSSDVNFLDDTLHTTLNITAPPDADLGMDQSICAGNSANLSVAQSGLNYLWSTGETTQSIIVTPAADSTYWVIVTGSTGCSSSDTIEITVNPLPVPSINAIPVEICMNWSDLTLSGNPAGGTFSGAGVSGNTLVLANAQSAVGIGNPFYIYYSVTNAQGCTGMDSVQTVLSLCASITENDGSFEVYPNPFSDRILIKNTNSTPITMVALYDLKGLMILTEVASITGQTTLSVPEIAPGIYLLQIATEEGVSTHKMVLDK